MSVAKKQASRAAEIHRTGLWRADITRTDAREASRTTVRQRMCELSARLKNAHTKAERLAAAAELDTLWSQVRAWQ